MNDAITEILIKFNILPSSTSSRCEDRQDTSQYKRAIWPIVAYTSAPGFTAAGVNSAVFFLRPDAFPDVRDDGTRG